MDVRAGPLGSPVTEPDPVEATWAELERVGRWTGHVVARCPVCGARAMVSILNGSGTSRWVKSGGGWPSCKQCSPGVAGKDRPRVEPLGDVALVARVKPGHVGTRRALVAVGLVAKAPPPERKRKRAPPVLDGSSGQPQ